MGQRPDERHRELAIIVDEQHVGVGADMREPAIDVAREDEGLDALYPFPRTNLRHGVLREPATRDDDLPHVCRLVLIDRGSKTLENIREAGQREDRDRAAHRRSAITTEYTLMRVGCDCKCSSMIL